VCVPIDCGFSDTARRIPDLLSLKGGFGTVRRSRKGATRSKTIPCIGDDVVLDPDHRSHTHNGEVEGLMFLSFPKDTPGTQSRSQGWPQPQYFLTNIPTFRTSSCLGRGFCLCYINKNKSNI